MPDTCRARLGTLLIALAGLLGAGCAQLSAPPPEEDVQRQAQRPSAQCTGKQGSPFSYRKKILVLPFPVVRPSEAVDVPDLSRLWSRALQARLHATDRFLIRDGGAYRIDPTRDIRPQVQALARQFDVQFVVTGNLLGLATEHASDRRVVSTEIQIHDGPRGEPMKQLAHEAEILGQVEHDGSPVPDGLFFRTPLGTALARLIQRQGEDIEDELACLPMQANILSADLREVHIDAGFNSNLVPGDRLRVFLRRHWSVTPDGRVVWQEESPGALVIKKVLPEASVGLLDAEEVPDWHAHGTVRAW
jgi:hypothetical protein